VATKSNVASTMLPVASTLLLVWTGRYVDVDVRRRRWWSRERLSTSWAREPCRCRRDVESMPWQELHVAHAACRVLLAF